MNKSFYEIIIENWAQITVLIGAVVVFIQTISSFWLKKREMTFSRIQENKILEIKAFYKSYQQLELALGEYVNQTRFGEHTIEIFNIIKENIRIKFIDFKYHSMTVKLFLDSEDTKIIDDINEIFESIRMDMIRWHIYNNSKNQPEGWDKLSEIADERLPKKLPELINKIETSLREYQQKIYFMPQLVVNMNITLLNLIYLQAERLVILKRHAAYSNRCSKL